MTKTKQRKTGTFCEMCGANQGQPHQDEQYKNLTVALAEYTGKMEPGRLLCQPCFQGCAEIDLEASGTPEGLLARAARLQTEFWEALSDLEAELGIEIEGTEELAGMTVEDLMEVYGEEN